MKNKIGITFIFFILLLLLSKSFGQTNISDNTPIINLSECNIKIDNITTVQELPSPDGAIEPASENKFLKVTLSGITPISGLFIIRTYFFGIIYNYRRLAVTAPLFANGIIWRNEETGDKVEMWHTDPDNIFTLSYDANEKIEFYLAFEVPDEVEEYVILIPMIVK